MQEWVLLDIYYILYSGYIVYIGYSGYHIATRTSRNLQEFFSFNVLILYAAQEAMSWGSLFCCEEKLPF